MTFRTHSQCIYFSITLASPHYDVMKLKSDKEQNESRSESGNTFRKRYVFYSAIDLDCNMSRSKVKGIVYLVVIIQRNSVQCGDFHFS